MLWQAMCGKYISKIVDDAEKGQCRLSYTRKVSLLLWRDMLNAAIQKNLKYVNNQHHHDHPPQEFVVAASVIMLLFYSYTICFHHL